MSARQAREARMAADARYAEAERAFSERRDADAAERFGALAEGAGDDVELRALAQYRRAQLRERAGDVAGALALYQASESAGATERSPFAAWRAARLLAERSERRAEGRLALQAAVDRYPDASAADKAAKYLALNRTPTEAADEALDRATVAWLLEAAERHKGASVGDNLLFWAGYVQIYRLGDLGEARTTLRTLAGRYFVSPLLDDTLWLLAAIERRQGRYDEAVATYEALLHLRVDQNYLIMGYRSRRLDDAAAAIGQVQYHLRRDPAAAAAAWRRLLDEFPLSVFRDDAHFGLACAEVRLGHPEAARAAARRLLEERPDSRFAAPARALVDGKDACPAPSEALARTPLSLPTVRGEM